MSMSEVIQRKAAIDAAITHHDAALFAANLLAWLEATAYLRTLPNLRKLGLEPGAIPQFGAADLRDISVRKEADDAVMGFCISAGIARDQEAFAAVDGLLTQEFGIIYPGSSALYHCNQIIDPIVTLDDAVGQILKGLLEGEILAPQALWNAGLRLLQRVRSSSFERELTPLLANFLRTEWAMALAQAKGMKSASLAGIETCLKAEASDQPFIAALLFVTAGAVKDLAIDLEYLAQLAKLAQRP